MDADEGAKRTDRRAGLAKVSMACKGQRRKPA
jgi:hypothetical protein